MVPRYLEAPRGFPKTPSERIEKYKLTAEPVDRPEVFDAERDAPDARRTTPNDRLTQSAYAV